MGNFFLDGKKKQSPLLRNRGRVEALTWGPSSGLDRVPSGRSRPRTADPGSPDSTGSPGRSFQALFLLAPTRACRPRHAHRSVPRPLPRPAPVFILERAGCRPGCLLGFSRAGSVRPAPCELVLDTNQVQPQPLLRPAECVRSLQGQGDWVLWLLPTRSSTE